MDYEKKYNEAIERAKMAVLKCRPLSAETNLAVASAVQSIFPQLRESEDERMIRKIKSFLSAYDAYYFRNDEWREIEVWLEKQKEPEKEELVYRLNGLMQEYINEAKDQEEEEHRFKCYKLFWDALEDASYFEQKEQKPIIAVDSNELLKILPKPAEWKLTWKDIVELEGIINNVHYEFRNGIGQESFGKEVLEKFREYKGGEYLDQKEQKPVDDKAFEKWLDDWYQGSKEAGGGVVMSESEFKNWSRGIRNMYEQKPVEWSEEDRLHYANILEALEYVKGCEYDYDKKEAVKSDIAWLKDFHPRKLDASKLENFDPVEILNRIKKEWPMAWDKVVGKQEWSEEDEENFKWFDKFFRAESVIAGGKDIPQDKYLWFKSLRPQQEDDFDKLQKDFRSHNEAFEAGREFERSRKPRWKPSEEQMEALQCAIAFMEIRKASDYDISPLKSLYEQLKKL